MTVRHLSRIFILGDSTRPNCLMTGYKSTYRTPGASDVMFFSDGNTLAARGDTTILWDVSGLNNFRDHAIERACTVTGGGLDRDEWARYIPDHLLYQDTCPVLMATDVRRRPRMPTSVKLAWGFGPASLWVTRQERRVPATSNTCPALQAVADVWERFRPRRR